MTNSIPTLTQLQRGLQIAEQIAALEAEMAAIFQGQPMKSSAVIKTSVSAPTEGKKRKRSKMSAEGRARIVAAQKARWAKIKGGAKKAEPKKKGSLSEAGRRKLALAMKRRWAEAKKSGGPAPTASKGKK